MAFSSTKSAFWTGFRDSTPFAMVVCPFALLFGVLATEAGLNLVETMVFAIIVIAGAAQFTALSLMEENVPTIIVLASALAVNLRLAMYSASLTPHLGQLPMWKRAFAAYLIVDQTYAVSVAQYEKTPEMTLGQKAAYFTGTVAPIYPLWYVFTLVGAVIGQQIPEAWALDFAIPIMFLALIGPMLRTPAHLAAAIVAIVLALLCAGVPYNLGLLIAGMGGMMTGAQVELWIEGRKHDRNN